MKFEGRLQGREIMPRAARIDVRYDALLRFENHLRQHRHPHALEDWTAQRWAEHLHKWERWDIERVVAAISTAIEAGAKTPFESQHAQRAAQGPVVVAAQPAEGVAQVVECADLEPLRLTEK